MLLTMNVHLLTKSILFYFSIFILLTLTACGAIKDENIQEFGTLKGRVWLDENADAKCDDCDCEFYLEDIPIRLYEAPCGGLILKTVTTNIEGVFTFSNLEPGAYCVMPNVKLICEGFQPTTSITQSAVVQPGETIELEWFGFDHHFDINE